MDTDQACAAADDGALISAEPMQVRIISGGVGLQPALEMLVMRGLLLAASIAGLVWAPALAFGQEWARCADEGEWCRFAGMKLVRYGAADHFRFGAFTDGVACSNDIFGDPIEGRRKSCWTYQTRAEAELQSRLEQSDQLRAELESRAEHINELQNYIQRLERRREDEINQLQAEVQSRDQRIAEFEERVHELETQLDWLRRLRRGRR